MFGPTLVNNSQTQYDLDYLFVCFFDGFEIRDSILIADNKCTSCTILQKTKWLMKHEACNISPKTD